MRLDSNLLRYYDYFFIAILFSVSFWISKNIYIDWDVSWHLEAARQIGEGVQHGKNIFDDNPPMVFWFFIPVVLLHHVSGISLITLSMLSAHFLVLISFILCNVYLKDIFYYSSPWEIRVIRYATLNFLLFFSIPMYAQREILLTAFCLPYIFLMASRMQINTDRQVKKNYLQAFTGLWMAIGIALNPMFAIIPIILEIQLWISTKKLTLIRPELITFVVIFLWYLFSISIFFPKYYSVDIPSFFAFTSNADLPLSEIIKDIPNIFIVFSILIFFVATTENLCRSWVTTLWLCAIASYAIFLCNKKIWYYHVFPAAVFSALLLMAILCCTIKAKKKDITHFLIGFFSVVFLCTMLLTELKFFIVSRDTYNNSHSTIRQLIVFFNQQPKHSTIISFSTRFAPIFPVISYTTLHYASSEPCFWELPLLIKNEHNLKMMNWQKQWIKKYKKIFISRVVSEMQRKKPNYVLVDVEKNKPYMGKIQFNYIDYFGQDPLFRKLWKKYHLVKKIPGSEIYEYKK